MNFKMKIMNTAFIAKTRIVKYSPELLLGASIITGVAATVLACKQTLKVYEVQNKQQERLDDIEAFDMQGNYVDDAEKQQDIMISKKDMIIDYAKLYAPAVLLGAVSVTCSLASLKIIKARHGALLTAYTGLQAAFDGYKKRVEERFGEDVEREIRLGIMPETTTETITMKNGKTKEVTSTKNKLRKDGLSPYADVITSDNSIWNSNPEYIEMFLNQAENHYTHCINARGVVPLNDVRKEIGFDPTPEGQVVGWAKGNGDGHIIITREFMLNDDEELICIVDFNVDGPVIDLIGKKKEDK